MFNKFVFIIIAFLGFQFSAKAEECTSDECYRREYLSRPDCTIENYKNDTGWDKCRVNYIEVNIPNSPREFNNIVNSQFYSPSSLIEIPRKEIKFGLTANENDNLRNGNWWSFATAIEAKDITYYQVNLQCKSIKTDPKYRSVVSEGYFNKVQEYSHISDELDFEKNYAEKGKLIMCLEGKISYTNLSTGKTNSCNLKIDTDIEKYYKPERYVWFILTGHNNLNSMGTSFEKPSYAIDIGLNGCKNAPKIYTGGEDIEETWLKYMDFI